METTTERSAKPAKVRGELSGREEFALWCGRVGIGYGTCADLMACARRLHRIAERECNGYQTWDHRWDEASQVRDERRELRLRAQVVALLAETGYRPEFGGDPRGAVVKLHRLPVADFESRTAEACVPSH